MKGREWVLFVMLTSAALTAATGGVKGQNVDKIAKPAAIVNGEIIAIDELDAALKSQGPNWMELPAAERRNRQHAMLSVLIDQLLMEQFMRQQGPKIDVRVVDKKLADLQMVLQKDGKTLEDFCRQTGQSNERLRAHVYFTVQWDAYARERIHDADLRRYYEENRDCFDRTLVHMSDIEVFVPPTAKEPDRQATREKLLGIRQDIISGKIDFATAARKYSQGFTAEQGGDLGEIPRKFVVEEPVAKTAFALAVGQVSDVIATEAGLHLIHVTGRRAGEPSRYEKVKEAVLQMRMMEMYQDEGNRLRKSANVTINIP